MRLNGERARTYLLLFYQRPGISFPSSTGCPADTMHILAHVDRHIVADHMGYVANIDASRYKIRANKAEQRLRSQVLIEEMNA
jgi:hypothetical protein